MNAGYRSNVHPATAGLPTDVAREVEAGIGSAFATAPRLGDSAPAVLNAARDAFVDGWRVSMWFGAALAAAAFLYVAVHGPRSADAEALATADVADDDTLFGELEPVLEAATVG